MRESGHEHSEHEWYRQISDLVKEYDQQEQAPERDLSSASRSDTLDRGGPMAGFLPGTATFARCLKNLSRSQKWRFLGA